MRGDERIGKLVEGATCEGRVRTTTDWSFLAERTVGDNWFLVGESAGFADPILAAGLTLAAAYILFIAILLIRPEGLFGRRSS